MNAPLLDLDTLAPTREQIRIKTKSDREGTLYDLAHIEDLSLAAQQVLIRDGTLVEKLGRGNLTPDKVQKLVPAVNRVIGVILPDLPHAVRDELHINQLMAIIQVFTKASPIPREAATAPTISTGGTQ